MTLREKSAAYLAQLAEMCRKLFSSPVVQHQAPGFVTGAQRLREVLRAYQGRRANFRLALEPNWKVDLTGRDICGATGQTELHFGGEIEFRDECLERQVITVVILFRADESADPRTGRPRLIQGEDHIVRRFHFDFDRSVASQRTPLAHLQIGGQLNPSYLSIPEASSLRYELFDQLDYPRLPWTISDLTIVLDIFLRQFPAGLDELIGGGAWRELVMESEQLWLKDFFRQAAIMMEAENSRQPLYDYFSEYSAFDY